MFKKAALCVLLFVVFADLLGAQDSGAKQIDPEKAALIEEMMNITRPDRLLPQVLQQQKAAFSKAFEDSFRNQLSQRNEAATKYQPEVSRFEDQMFALITDRMSWDKLKPKFITLYNEIFSKQELVLWLSTRRLLARAYSEKCPS